MKEKWSSLRRSAEELLILLVLAEHGALIRGVETSTNKLAKMLGMSQQSASRKLRELERKGLITREIKSTGEIIKITDYGASVLMEYRDRLQKVLGKAKKGVVTIRGYIVRGLGEGRYYMSLKGYVVQVEEKLGFKPYPGTLNIKLKTVDDILRKLELQKLPGIMIKGFSNGVRTYGNVKAFKAEINGTMPLAVVLPERTSHGIDVLEIIAPFNIREKLKLSDGDEVTVTVYLQ
jgi:riboflavin kinase